MHYSVWLLIKPDLSYSSYHGLFLVGTQFTLQLSFSYLLSICYREAYSLVLFNLPYLIVSFVAVLLDLSCTLIYTVATSSWSIMVYLIIYFVIILRVGVSSGSRQWLCVEPGLPRGYLLSLIFFWTVTATDSMVKMCNSPQYG